MYVGGSESVRSVEVPDSRDPQRRLAGSACDVMTRTLRFTQ
jgi:hypothetical protein